MSDLPVDGEALGRVSYCGGLVNCEADGRVWFGPGAAAWIDEAGDLRGITDGTGTITFPHHPAQAPELVAAARAIAVDAAEYKHLIGHRA